jgi:FAD/FMN-containing dehydrogenase
MRWGHDLRDALQPYTAGGVYVNALGDEPTERVRSAYGSNWQRLTQIKRQYDPDNVFHNNANIQPAPD